jgi:hypothetical protein
MKTKNNLTTGILIGIGMIVIPLIIMSSKPISSTNNGVVYGTPESHEWEIYGGEGNTGFLLNKVTGELKIIDVSGIKPKLKIPRED